MRSHIFSVAGNSVFSSCRIATNLNVWVCLISASVTGCGRLYTQTSTNWAEKRTTLLSCISLVKHCCVCVHVALGACMLECGICTCEVKRMGLTSKTVCLL